MSVSARTDRSNEKKRVPVISVGVDGTPAGDAALSWALDEAVLRGDAIEAVSVWPYPMAGSDGSWVPVLPDRGAGTTVRGDVVAALARVGYQHQVPVDVEGRFGIPGIVLGEEADAVAAELVVIGRSSGHLTRELLFGSISHVLCHGGNRPVVTVPPPAAGQPAATGAPADRAPRRRDVIAVGVDGSERSQVALRWALEEAALRRAHVRAVLVWDDAPGARAAGAVAVVPDSEPTAEAQAASVVSFEVRAALQATPEASGVPVTEVAVRGSARDVFLKEAAAADLLVMGDHQRSVLGDVMLGSTTRTCLQHGSAPVVIVPGPNG
jgi:nucleotide-binding universal stress UspA family protein